VGASERDEFLRAAWRAIVAGGIESERLVFVDEMGTNTSLTRPFMLGPDGENGRRVLRRATGELRSPCSPA
jgi:hypothetical protein